MSDSDVCPVCGSACEDVVHFLLECPQYERERASFFYRIHQMYIKNDMEHLYDTLLNEPNLMKAVYILDSEPVFNSLSAELDVLVKSFLKEIVGFRFADIIKSN